MVKNTYVKLVCVSYIHSGQSITDHVVRSFDVCCRRSSGARNVWSNSRRHLRGNPTERRRRNRLWWKRSLHCSPPLSDAPEESPHPPKHRSDLAPMRGHDSRHHQRIANVNQHLQVGTSPTVERPDYRDRCYHTLVAQEWDRKGEDPPAPMQPPHPFPGAPGPAIGPLRPSKPLPWLHLALLPLSLLCPCTFSNLESLLPLPWGWHPEPLSWEPLAPRWLGVALLKQCRLLPLQGVWAMR